MKGVEDSPVADASMETMCDMAGAALETAAALHDAATGKITEEEALTKIGRAGIAATCRWGIRGLKTAVATKLALIPVYGPPLAAISMAVLTFVENPMIIAKIAAFTCENAIKAYRVMKRKVKKWIRRKLKITEKVHG
jgi:hypothetical protein